MRAVVAALLSIFAAHPSWAQSASDVPTMPFWGKVILLVALVAISMVTMKRMGHGAAPSGPRPPGSRDDDEDPSRP